MNINPSLCWLVMYRSQLHRVCTELVPKSNYDRVGKYFRGSNINVLGSKGRIQGDKSTQNQFLYYINLHNSRGIHSATVFIHVFHAIYSLRTCLPLQWCAARVELWEASCFRPDDIVAMATQHPFVFKLSSIDILQENRKRAESRCGYRFCHSGV